ncbi:Glycerophosphocholine phosphodiesterase GDE1 [Taenia solium]|eukprot:TsM_000854700 transcript=TsM_000854700 gene=TsM_000854700
MIPTPTTTAVEVNLAADPSSVAPPMVARFEFPTNVATEEGSETVNIDSDGGELDRNTDRGACLLAWTAKIAECVDELQDRGWVYARYHDSKLGVAKSIEKIKQWSAKLCWTNNVVVLAGNCFGEVGTIKSLDLARLLKELATLYETVYYLMIRPTLPLDTGEDDSLKNNSARGFTLRPVNPAAGLDEASLLCVGHRGMGAERAETPTKERWPENTLLSFNKAAELNVPMVELDVQPLRDSNDLVIYHSFNVATRRSNRNRPCGCPDYEIDVFGESGICNKTMPNLIPTFSLNELQDLKWGSHSKTCEKATCEREAEEVNSKARVEGEEVVNNCPISLQRGTQQAQYLPLFSEVLATVPTRLALDVELKYPQDTPNMAFRLVHEVGVNKEVLEEFGHPSRYFYSINQFADNVIRILQTQGNGRGIVLSTFNADLCLALRLKQTTFPVLFISRAGCEQPLSAYIEAIPPPHSSTRLPPPPHSLDPRHRNTAAVIEWARLIGMDGVVIPGKPLVTTTAEGADLAHRMAASHLACIPFGPCVSTPAFKRHAAELGLTGICIDDVHRNAW